MAVTSCPRMAYLSLLFHVHEAPYCYSFGLLDVGMPCLHPHPKNLFAFAPCPFPVWVLSTHFSASASRPLPLLAPVVCMHCTCNAKLNYGARDPRGHGPFTIIIATIFWGTGKRRPTRTPTRYMLGSAGPSLPPYPPPRDCKGQLWRG